ncbi:Blue-light-activated protein [Planctomycetes bacterium CA13]|uniref:histidine kinase n=2 Tax=Novipirellula herctigrandis TaxID=2527986 RepID=A0A5C5ZCU0_9BACT|nr:Blue-light-activated protein [Planctomycetes bacterium CA13]
MSELSFEAIFDLTSDFLCVMNLDGYFIRTNTSFRRHLGWTSDEFVDRSFVSMTHTDDLYATLSQFSVLSKHVASVFFDHRFRCVDGTYCALRWRITRESGSDTLLAAGYLVRHSKYRDTKSAVSKKQGELARIAHAASEDWRTLGQQTSRIGIWEFDLTTGGRWWSTEINEMFEFDSIVAESSIMAFQLRVHPDDWNDVVEAYNRSVSRKTAFEIKHRLLMPDGRIKHVHELGRTIYDDNGLPLRSIGTIEDITQQLQGEGELRLSEERLRQAVRVSNIGFFDHDHLTDVLFWSTRMREIYGGYLTAEITLPDTIKMIHPDETERLVQSIQKAHDPSGNGIWDEEYRILLADGSTRWVIARSQTFFAGTGSNRHPVRTIGALVDATERKQAEEALRVTDRALATSMTAFAIADETAQLTYVNQAFLNLWGYDSEAEVIDKLPQDMIEPESAQRMMDGIYSKREYRGELLIIRKDGTNCNVMASTNTIHDSNGKVVNMIGSFVDITESKKLQELFMQSQKMESIGRLAGGIAHDFNNLLMVINGYLELALIDLGPHESLRSDLSEVKKAADRASSLTQQLLAFSRKQIIKPQVLNPNDVIGSMTQMLERLLGEDIELQTILAADLGQVQFDLGQCEQCLLNLAINARDAMSEGGKLVIETENVQTDKACDECPPGEYVVLAISDNGSGMTEEDKSHLFEPFYTTKEVGAGTGLGLAMVFGAVTQNKGRISVESKSGYGTTFRVYLPRVYEASKLPDPVSANVTHRGTETIVIVEDENAVRELTARLLTNLGYKVLAFPIGGEAIDAVSSMTQTLDLLITDVIMPGINGTQMAEKMSALRPEIKVIITSGYTPNAFSHLGVLKNGVEFLPKPYSFEMLAELVRRVLDKPVG